MPRIIAARITEMPISICDPMPQVIATFDDGTEKKLFEYYPDEISFVAGEFIGLTEGEARDLKCRKDKQYLQC